MSDQSQPLVRGPQPPAELGQRTFDQFSTNREVIEELSDEELEIVSGGAGISALFKGAKELAEKKGVWKYIGSASLTATTVQVSNSLKRTNEKQQGR